MIFVGVMCDSKGCENSMRAGFDDPSETYGDLLRYLKQAGWSLTETHTEDGQPNHKTICPDCVRRAYENNTRT